MWKELGLRGSKVKEVVRILKSKMFYYYAPSSELGLNMTPREFIQVLNMHSDYVFIPSYLYLSLVHFCPNSLGISSQAERRLGSLK